MPYRSQSHRSTLNPTATIHRLCVLLLVFVFLAGQAATPAHATGATLYVVPGGVTSGTCDSWSAGHACDLQFALNEVAGSGDALWVKEGTYTPGSLRTNTFTLKNGVGIYGGFAGTEGATEFSLRNPTTHVTILSGEIGAAGATDNVYHVVTGGGTSSTAVLDGFTVTAGNANAASGGNAEGGGMYIDTGSPTLTNVTFSTNSAAFGGGIYCFSGSPTLTLVRFLNNSATSSGGGMYVESSSPTLSNVTFSGNSTTNSGGGMHIDSASSPTLTNVTFSTNSAGTGGGIASYGGTPTLSFVTFSGNTTTGSGGGMYTTGANPTLYQLIFSGNSATGSGGGLNNDNGSPALTDVTFSGNSAGFAGGGFANSYGSSPKLENLTFSGNSAFQGGAIWNYSSGSPTLTNVTISGNSATSAGGGMYNAVGSNPTIYDTIFWNDGTEISDNDTSSPVIKDSIVSGGCPSGAVCTHVLGSNPLLGALASHGGYNKTMALGAGSPAIDAGGAHSTCTDADQRGVGRPQGAACDIGAYEARYLTFRSTGSQDGWILESGENTNVGGSMLGTGPYLALGDDTNRKQYRSILSFATSALPDNAMIDSAILKFKRSSVAPAGTNPINLLQGIMLDMKKGYFGTVAGLQLGDFQAAANKTVGPFSPVLTGGWYTINLSNATFAYINKLATNGGLTQIRLRFKLGDNDNAIANLLKLLSGNDATATNRPTLIIVYTIPPPD